MVAAASAAGAPSNPSTLFLKHFTAKFSTIHGSCWEESHKLVAAASAAGAPSNRRFSALNLAAAPTR